MPTDTQLAERIERNRLAMFRSVAEGAALAGVPGPTILETGRATAIYAGNCSPITQTVGIQAGFNLREIVEFYRGRTENFEAAITPFGGAEPVNTLLEAGAVFEQFENINFRFLNSELPPLDPTIEIREIKDLEGCEVWSSVVSRGFHGENTNEVINLLNRVSARIPNSRRYLAYVEGQPVGGAALLICEDAVFLGGASTLQEFRGRGLHSALVAHRLHHAPKHCDLALMQALPGSQSQANIQRFGFQLAFTQFSLRLELPA